MKSKINKMSLKGDVKLIGKLNRVIPAIKRGVKAGTQHVEGKAKVYAPSSAANAPKQYPGQWYERGWGVKWALNGGGWHGRKTSENLMAKWTIDFDRGGLRGTVGNNTSYGPYVQDEKKQASALKIIGWRTIQDVAKEELPRVTDFIQAQVDAELRKA